MSYEGRKKDVFVANEAANKLVEELSNIIDADDSRRGRVIGLVGEIQEALLRVYDASEAELKESKDRKDQDVAEKDAKRPVARR